jgi:hypothetical protein
MRWDVHARKKLPRRCHCEEPRATKQSRPGVITVAPRLLGFARNDRLCRSMEPLPALRLMQIENRIAEGIFNVEDWWSLERMSSPSGLNCPDCHSALYDLADKRMLRFRCRSGHVIYDWFPRSAFGHKAMLCAIIQPLCAMRSSTRSPFPDESGVNRQSGWLSDWVLVSRELGASLAKAQSLGIQQM